MIKIRRRLCNVFALLSLNVLAQDVPPTWAFKMTPSVYSARQQPMATDLNLRGHWGQHTVWVGHYTRPGEFQQTRSGYEFNADMGGVQVTPSLQAASHGFWGGSLNATVGETVYGLVGWGRTNLKDYYNLNFDPNDAMTWGLGWRVYSNNQVTLFKIKDNRLHTDQEVTHWVWRYNANVHQRWTVDLSQKQGRPSQGLALVQGNTWSLAYDHHALFFKIARDQKVNFSDIDQWRVAVGWRF